jgi:hypothetical protein
MPGVFVGDTKALVFPVMCDGYLQLKYADKNASTGTHVDLRQGIWGHNSSFTIEAIITPYDVNGFGSRGSTSTGVTTSEKTPPSVNEDNSSKSNYQSEDYFSTNRLTHKMMLFHSDGFELYLQNTTSNNFNQPAEYKLCAKISGQNAIETDTIISARNSLYGYYDSTALYDGIDTSLRFLDTATATNPGVASVISLATSTNDRKVGIGTELFDSNGTSIGTITNKNNAGSLTLSEVQYTRDVYYSQPKEATYLETMYKITCCVDINGKIRLYLNNVLLVEQTTTISNFNFGTTDCYIGQDPDVTNPSTTQFMGELYEIAMYKKQEPSLNSTTLNIGYNDIIFYYRFGDE